MANCTLEFCSQAPIRMAMGNYLGSWQDFHNKSLQAGLEVFPEVVVAYNVPFTYCSGGAIAVANTNVLLLVLPRHLVANLIEV